MKYLVLCGYNHPVLVAEFIRREDAGLFCEAYLKQSAYANMFIVDSDKCRFIPEPIVAEVVEPSDPFADDIEHIR